MTGSCGDDAYYALDDSGNLFVVGNGAINGLSGVDQNQIKTVSIGEGLTSIENDAFAYCTSLTSVTMPYLDYIGAEAFYRCISLASIDMLTVTHIGWNAFME